MINSTGPSAASRQTTPATRTDVQGVADDEIGQLRLARPDEDRPATQRHPRSGARLHEGQVRRSGPQVCGRLGPAVPASPRTSAVSNQGPVALDAGYASGVQREDLAHSAAASGRECPRSARRPDPGSLRGYHEAVPRGDGRLNHDLDPHDRGPQDACGVFGVWAPNEEVAKLAYFGIYALQHRGQESAGIAVSKGTQIVVFKDMGLVSQVFNEADPGVAGPGPPGDRPLPLLHDRRERLEERPADLPLDRVGRHRPRPQRQPDQHPGAADLAGRTRRRHRVAAARLAAQRRHHRHRLWSPPCWPPFPGETTEEAALQVLPRLRGAFSLVFMDEETLYAARDPQGIRPLVLGRLERGWVVASETAALDIVGASFVREVAPGELIAIDGRRAAQHDLRPGRAQGLPVRVRLPGPAGHHDLRPPAALGPGRGRPHPGPGVPGRGRSGDPGAGVGHAGRDRVRGGVRDPVRAGPGQELLRRPHLHPAQPDHPAARHPAQAQPAARRDRRQAAGRGRRLDRPRQHPARAGPDAARGRRGRGARADLLAAGEVAVLLRHRLRLPGRADRQRARTSTRSAARSAPTRSAMSRWTGWSPPPRSARTRSAGPASTASTRSSCR